MSDVETQDEVVTDVDLNRQHIDAFIDQIQANNWNQAEKSFSDLVGGRLATALDQQKAKIAGQVFDTTDVEFEDEEDVELNASAESDEEYEDEVDLTPDDFDIEDDEDELEN